MRQCVINNEIFIIEGEGLSEIKHRTYILPDKQIEYFYVPNIYRFILNIQALSWEDRLEACMGIGTMYINNQIGLKIFQQGL